MTQIETHRICPVERSGSLDSRFRKWAHNPAKLLKKHVSGNMTVMDIGCGPGFFSVEMAKMLGPQGKVLAVDMQKAMLDKVKSKIMGTRLQEKIELHLCQQNSLAIDREIDFALAFYVIHEILNKENFFAEVYYNLKNGGRMYIAEPWFHVNKKAFLQMLELLQKQGFHIIDRPKVGFSRAVLVEK